MIFTKQEFLLKIDFDYLLRFASETKLYRNYRKYFTKKDFVNALLRNLTQEQCEDLYNAFINNIPPEEMARFFLFKNPTYEIIKDKLIKYISKNKEDTVIFSEFPVLNSRTDVTMINHKSYNYEIKTDRDKLERLKFQLPIFITVFERNFVVCSINSYPQVLEYVPHAVGIIVYEIQDDKIYFREEVPSRRSNDLKSENQLAIITLKSLRSIYEKRIGKASTLTKQQLIEKIRSHMSDSEINKEFKDYLKNKYLKVEYD